MDHVETLKSSDATKFNSKEKSGMQNTAASALSSRGEIPLSSSRTKSETNQLNSGKHFAPDEIARQAYSLYEKQGCPQGCAEQHWFEAEQLLQRRSNSSAPQG